MGVCGGLAMVVWTHLVVDRRRWISWFNSDH